MRADEILFPEKKEYIISGRKYYIGKLLLPQVYRLSRVIVKSIINSKRRLEELQTRTSAETTNTQDILTILDIVSDAEVTEIFSIILKEDDKDFLANNLDFAVSVSMVKDLCEMNKNILDVKKNILEILDSFFQVLRPEQKK